MMNFCQVQHVTWCFLTHNTMLLFVHHIGLSIAEFRETCFLGHSIACFLASIFDFSTKHLITYKNINMHENMKKNFQVFKLLSDGSHSHLPLWPSG